jgi:hypothetical protein
LDITVASAAIPAYVLGVGICAFKDAQRPTVTHQRITSSGEALEVKKLNTLLLRKLGSLFVSSGFDEIPQMAHVLSGSMSIVGPRAITAEDMDGFLSQLPRTLLQTWRETMPGVKPGIVSTYALAEHSADTNKDRATMDIFDVRHASLKHDMYLLSRIGRTSTKPLLVPIEEFIEPTELTLVADLAPEPMFGQPSEQDSSEEVA